MNQPQPVNSLQNQPKAAPPQGGGQINISQPKPYRPPTPAIAQLAQAAPSTPDPIDDAYMRPATPDKRGGLPMEIVAAAQKVYAQRSGQNVPNQPKQDNKQLEEGWGGKGR